jgi:hypothetical protein
MGSILGKLTGGLTKTGVTQPTGTTQYFDTPEEATAAASKQLPSAETILGSDVLHPSSAVPAMPVVTKPSFSEAQDHPEALTKGGVLASLIFSGAEGAAAGLAASQPINGGRTSPGVGPAMLAGFDVPRRDQERRLMLRREQLDQQKEAAQIAALPGQLEQERQLRQSQIDQNKATADRKDNYTIPGVGLVTPDESQPNGFRVLVPEQAKDQSLDLMIAHASAQAIKEGRDPSSDSLVKQLQAVKDAGQKDPTNDPVYRDWRAQNPNAPIENYLKLVHPRENGAGGVPTDDINTLAAGLIDGTLSVQALGRMGAGQKAAVVAHAKRLDPSFDMTTYPARLRVAEDFASGKSADQVMSFNVFLQHSRDLSNAVNDLRASSIPLVNKSLLWLRKNSGDPVVASYLAKVEPVRTEFETFLQGGHALTESDKQAAQKVLDENASPAQMQSVIKSLSHTAALRLKELDRKYSNTMHRSYPGLIDPDNMQFLADTGAASALTGKGQLRLRGTGATSQPTANDPLGLF